MWTSGRKTATEKAGDGFGRDMGGRPAARDADLGREARDEIVQHRRHQRPFLLAQAVGWIEEEIASNRRQAAGTARVHGIDRTVGCFCSNRPLFRHHQSLR